MTNRSPPPNARAGLDPPLAQRERGEEQAGRPAFGSPRELDGLRPGDVDPGSAQERVRLGLVEAKLAGRDLEQASFRAQSRRREERRPAREGERRSLAQALDEQLERLEACGLAQDMDVVDDDHERRHRGDRRPEPRCDAPPRRPPAPGGRLEDPRVERLDAVERGADAGQQEPWVVVTLVGRDPRERPPVAIGPL